MKPYLTFRQILSPLPAGISLDAVFSSLQSVLTAGKICFPASVLGILTNKKRLMSSEVRHLNYVFHNMTSQ